MLILYTLHLVVMAEVEGFHLGRVLCFVVRAEVGVLHLEFSMSCDRYHALRARLQPSGIQHGV